jgi:tetratricopeptide (TPR) repeat protein
MIRAGYDGREAARIWQNLRAELSAGAGGDPAKKSVLFASHPPTDEREQALQAQAGAGGGLLGEEAFAARIEPYMAQLLEDELRRSQYDETIVLMDRLIERRPRRADLRFARGEARRLRQQDGDLDAAVLDYEHALQLDGAPPQALRGIGFVRRQQGRKPEAAASFESYLQRAPAAPDAALIQSYVNELKT